MLPVLSRTPLQSLAGFCLIKHITSNTFLQQTSYLYCSCQLVLGVTSAWKLANRRWISEQVCLDSASPTILTVIFRRLYHCISHRYWESYWDHHSYFNIIPLSNMPWISMLGSAGWWVAVKLIAVLSSSLSVTGCWYPHTLHMRLYTLLWSTSQCQKISVCSVGGRIC